MSRRASLHDRPVVVPTQRATDDTVLGAERRRQEVIDVRVREIMPNRKQPRTVFDDAMLDELAASIREHGVLQPVIVRVIPLTEYEGAGRRYELIAGERRWRASQRAAKETIPAIVLAGTTDEHTMIEVALVENLQRADLHPLDEALAFGRMQTELNYSYATIAERVGKSKGYVQNRMRLLQLPEDLQRLVAERPDTIGHVVDLARIGDAAGRAALVTAVRDEGLSRAQTRAHVEALLGSARSSDEHRPHDAYVQTYDREEHHDVRQEPADTSYVQTYDREKHHTKQPRDASQLSGREHATLIAIASRIQHWSEDPALLTQDDWAILETVAQRLALLFTARTGTRD